MGINDAAQLQKIQERVSFYQSCFWVCLVGMILFCFLAIFLCIYFRIPSIIVERLGIKRKRTLSRMDNAMFARPISYKPKEIKEYEEAYVSPSETVETASEQTVLLTEEDAFVMEKDIVLSEVRNRQKKSEE